jgi:hypothetical protein
MTSAELFAFVILPLSIAALGWVIALAVDWRGHRGDANH